VSAMNKNNNC